MVTLLTLYNGLPAILCGVLAALVMFVLFTFGSLPGFQRVADSTSDHSAWQLGEATDFSFAFLCWVYFGSDTRCAFGVYGVMTYRGS